MLDIPTRAISLHAPWAWAIMHAGKDVENRSKNFPRRYRGESMVGRRVWIHASLWPGPPELKEGTIPWNNFYGEFDQMCFTLLRVLGKCRLPKLAQQTLLAMTFPSIADGSVERSRGHIVGSVYVEGYQAPDEPPDSPWYVSGSLAILVRDPRPLDEPVPAKGALGWWSPPDDVMSALRRAVTP